MLAILSMLGGGLLRFLPELLALMGRKTDNAHELAMMDKQIELHKLDKAAAHDQLDANAVLGMLEAQKSALSGQMQKTGYRLVDTLNFLVRPLSTYYFLGCYGIVKTAMIVVAVRAADPWASIIQCWSEQDASILSGILAFWFVGRVFDRKS